MNPSYQVRSLLLLGAAVVLAGGTFVATNSKTGRAEAQEQEICLDSSESYSDTFGIPPTGSIWREIVPSFHKERHQTDFGDEDADRVVSVGDYIFLDGTRFRVTSDGSAVYLDCSRIIETQNGITPVGLTEITWDEVYPEYGRQLGQLPVSHDNGDGVFSVGDYMKIDGVNCYAMRIGRSVRVVEASNSAEAESWGAVKALFKETSRRMP